MATRAKLLREPLLFNCQLDTYEQASEKLESKYGSAFEHVVCEMVAICPEGA